MYDIDYRTLLFASSIHILFFRFIKNISFKSFVFNIILHYIYGLSITCGLHRLWTHASYETYQPIKWIIMVVNSGTIMNSIEDWCSSHKMHHKYEELCPDYDLYSISRGFFYAHIGWLFFNRTNEFNKIKKDITCDMYRTQWKKDTRLIEFNRDHYIPLMVTMSFLFPIGFCKCVLNTSWKSAIAGTLARILITWHSTWLVNSLAHYSGTKPFTRNHTSCENKIVSFFAFGEGFHNYHHMYPKDFRASGDYEGNLSAQLLRGLYRLGLIWDCKYVKEAYRKTRNRNIDFKSIKYSILDE